MTDKRPPPKPISAAEREGPEGIQRGRCR